MAESVNAERLDVHSTSPSLVSQFTIMRRNLSARKNEEFLVVDNERT